MHEHNIVNKLDKWEYVNLLNNGNVELDIERLKCLSKDDDDELRIEISEILSNFQNDAVDEILYNMLSDNCEIVRANVCYALYNSENSKTVNYLLDMLEDKSEMVRGYAVMSLTDIVINNEYDKKQVIASLFSKLDNQSEWVLISYFRALYMFGEKSYIKKIGDKVSCDEYRVQIFALRTLGELVDDENLDYITEIIQQDIICTNPESFEDAKQEVLNKIENRNMICF